MKKSEQEKGEDRILVSKGRPYMLQKNLADYFGLSLATVQSRLKEIDSLIGNRYHDTAVIRDGNLVLANVLAFIDYEMYRQRLLNPTTAKYVPPFDPVNIRQDLGFGVFAEETRKVFHTA